MIFLGALYFCQRKTSDAVQISGMCSSRHMSWSINWGKKTQNQTTKTKKPTLNDGEKLQPELDYIGWVIHESLYYHWQPLSFLVISLSWISSGSSLPPFPALNDYFRVRTWKLFHKPSIFVLSQQKSQVLITKQLNYHFLSLRRIQPGKQMG